MLCIVLLFCIAQSFGASQADWGIPISGKMGPQHEGLEPKVLPTTIHNVTRAQVMRCAEQWVRNRIPYCQCSGGPSSECCGTCPHCSTTRCDCSGFVSYCWGFRVGYTTRTLPTIAYRIQKHELRPGDIMLYEAEHVAFFGGWSDRSNTTFWAYQEPGCHTVGPHYAFKSSVPYPFNWNPQDFLPYRYKGILN